MASLIKAYAQRGMYFLVVISFFWLIVYGAALITGGTVFDIEAGQPVPESDVAIGEVLDSTSPLAQLIALLFWLVLVFIVGVVWSKVIFHEIRAVESFITGTAVAFVAFPLALVLSELVLRFLAFIRFPMSIDISGGAQSYFLGLLFFTFLVGLMALIGREVFHAGASDTHKTS